MTAKKTLGGSISLRLAIISLMVLILLIPTGMISGLINERKNRKEEAINEVTAKWAKAQTIGGLVVTIPTTGDGRTANGKPQTAVDYIHFLPQMLQIEAESHSRNEI